MRLNLKKPIVFFDLETTGIDPARDRIVEISTVKVFVDGHTETKTRRLNPEMHIPAEATAIHGITDEDVADQPRFREIAKSLAAYLEGCDLGGYNSNKFDVPVLVEEFLRAGVNVDFKNRNFVDVQNIFHKMEQRTLSAAYKFYCGAPLVDAHSALADTRATYEVFKAQLDRYTEAAKDEYEGKYLTNDIDSWVSFSTQNRNVDFAGRIILNEHDVPVFNFGKYKGRSVEEIFQLEPSYYSWMMQGDFPLNTKNVITEIYTRARRRF